MTSTDAAEPRHYPTEAAKYADLIVHVVGLTLALVGGIVLLTLAVLSGRISQLVGVSIYAVGVVVMLAFSTAYNFAPRRLQPRLERLDQAGIFLMIAGSYTPFTTQSLSGGWAWGMTAAVWSIAGFGALSKLLFPRLTQRFSLALYLALGWLVVVAAKPMFDALTWYALLLVIAAGALTWWLLRRTKAL